MTTTPAKRSLLTAGLAVVMGTAGAAPSWAAEIKYGFQVSIDSGPLLNNVYSGSFSYDDTSLNSTGPSSIALKDFKFIFENTLYTKNDDPLATAEFLDQVFLGLSYNVSQPPQPTFIPGFFDVSEASFAYDLQPGTTGQGGTGTTNYQKVVAPPSSSVPAPVPVMGAAAFFGYSRSLRSRIARRRRLPSTIPSD
jgi:hypothetical protein